MPIHTVINEPHTAYNTATENRNGRIRHNTAENEMAVIVPLMISSMNDKVVVVNALTSSVIRWSGLGTPQAESNRKYVRLLR